MSNMSRETAISINSKLVEAFMISEGISENDFPDMSEITLAQAFEATKIMDENPVIRHNENGSRTIALRLDQAAIPRILSIAITNHRTNPEAAA